MGLEWKLNCWPFCLKEQSLNTVEVTHNDIFNMWMTSDRSLFLKQYYCCVSCYFCHFIVVHCDVMQTTQRSSLATILSTFPFTLCSYPSVTNRPRHSSPPCLRSVPHLSWALSIAFRHLNSSPFTFLSISLSFTRVFSLTSTEFDSSSLQSIPPPLQAPAITTDNHVVCEHHSPGRLLLDLIST